MSGKEPTDLSSLTMVELFALEVEQQTQALTGSLLALEKGELPDNGWAELMRAAHSIKGGARITGVNAAVGLAHAMEDLFTAAGRGGVEVGSADISLLLKGVDLLSAIAQAAGREGGCRESQAQGAAALAGIISGLARGEREPEPGRSRPEAEPASEPTAPCEAEPRTPAAGETTESGPGPERETGPVISDSGPEEPAVDRTVRVAADIMDRLFSLSGELAVETGQFEHIRGRVNTCRRWAMELTTGLNELGGLVEQLAADDRLRVPVNDLRSRTARMVDWLNQSVDALEAFDHRASGLTREIYTECSSHRMRPFSEGIVGLERMVRDLSRTLGKKANLEIRGLKAQVDRDILERLGPPLAHLIQNALDHGLEGPEKRLRLGKPEQGLIRLEARHKGGLLSIRVADDGRGVDVRRLREAIVRRGLAGREMAAVMETAELMEFTFLPGFSLKDEVSRISGRGAGLDVVRSMVHQVRGSIRVNSEPGRGMTFELLLPLTLAVMRALLVEIGGEAYAFPIGRVLGALSVEPDQVKELEGRQYVAAEGRQVGLMDAAEILELPGGAISRSGLLSVVALERGKRCFGLVVDRFLGEKQLVEKPLDTRLDKVQDVSSASILEDGRPVLIMDVDDLTETIERVIEGRGLSQVRPEAAPDMVTKNILVVDDSITVREVERNLLTTSGFDVVTAVDGMDGWNTLRRGRFDLVITDVDMPRVDGIELVRMIRRDPRLKDLPVMIVSYKDRDEDRVRGLEAGADQYITKGSFHDETLVASVVDLIGRPEDRVSAAGQGMGTAEGGEERR